MHPNENYKFKLEMIVIVLQYRHIIMIFVTKMIFANSKQLSNKKK